MSTTRTRRWFLFALISGALFVLVQCSPLTPEVTPEITPAEQESLNVQVRIEKTGLRANPDLGNVAWSHDSNMLAYVEGFGIWVAPVGKWADTALVHHPLISSAIIHPPASRFLAWSPDDSAIGYTLFQTDFRTQMAQWSRQDQVDTLLTEDAELIDWSMDNEILALRDDGAWVWNLSSQVWQRVPSLMHADCVFPRWLTDEEIVIALPSSCQWETATISLFNLGSGQWEVTTVDDQPIQLTCNEKFPCIPTSSLDGRWIAWIETEQRADVSIWRILLYDREQSQVTEVANSQEYGGSSWRALAWSPSFEQMAFLVQEEEYTIWILHLHIH